MRETEKSDITRELAGFSFAGAFYSASIFDLLDQRVWNFAKKIELKFFGEHAAIKRFTSSKCIVCKKVLFPRGVSEFIERNFPTKRNLP